VGRVIHADYICINWRRHRRCWTRSIPGVFRRKWAARREWARICGGASGAVARGGIEDAGAGDATAIIESVMSGARRCFGQDADFVLRPSGLRALRWVPAGEVAGLCAGRRAIRRRSGWLRRPLFARRARTSKVTRGLSGACRRLPGDTWLVKCARCFLFPDSKLRGAEPRSGLGPEYRGRDTIGAHPPFERFCGSRGGSGVCRRLGLAWAGPLLAWRAVMLRADGPTVAPDLVGVGALRAGAREGFALDDVGDAAPADELAQPRRRADALCPIRGLCRRC